MLTTTEQTILLAVKAMAEAGHWSEITEIHRHLNLCGIHTGDDYPSLLELTQELVDNLFIHELLRESILHEHGRDWAHIRLTRKGKELVEGLPMPKAIAEAYEPIILPKLDGYGHTVYYKKKKAKRLNDGGCYEHRDKQESGIYQR